MLNWFIGLIVVIFVILAQMILPFAFDFLSTLGVYGVGVYVGNNLTKKT